MPHERPRRPTLDTVAGAVGVSRATVSNAYNRPDQLSPELREQILRTARELGYGGPDPVARSLATQRCGAVAVLIDSDLSTAFSDPALSITLDALSSAMDSEDHALLLLAGGKEAGPSPERVRRAQADVMISYSLSEDAPALQAAQERGMPLVIIDQPVMPGAARVEIDDFGGAKLAAQHVIEHGHRRIAVLSDEIAPDPYRGPVDAGRMANIRYRVTRDRMAGYVEVLEAAGISTADVPVWEAGGIQSELGAQGARWLLEHRPRPTALLCMTDHLALGATRAARAAGLRVPGDVSIVGFDDSSVATRAEPALTTVHQDLVGKGRSAGELALRLLAGEPPGPVIRLPTELVVRDSSGPAPSAP